MGLDEVYSVPLKRPLDSNTERDFELRQKCQAFCALHILAFFLHPRSPNLTEATLSTH